MEIIAPRAAPFTALATALFSAIATHACAQVPKLSPDLHEIQNLKSFRAANSLNKADVAQLKKNWFFVSPSDYEEPWDVYGNNDYNYIPSLVTVDNSLQLLHLCFDSTLQQIEREKLSSGTRKLAAAMLATSIKDWKAAQGTPMANAAAKNLAYFAVGDRLTGGKDPYPAAIASMVKTTLAMIDAHSGFKTGPIFPYVMDFSQFIPRGHYTRTPALTRYFKTMMWFGLTLFSAPNKPTDSLEPMEQALLMSHELTHSDQLARWQRMMDVGTMLMGSPNHLTPVECEACAKTVFGPTPTYAAWADETKLHTFIDKLAQVRPPMYTEDVHFSNSPDKVQVRFMAQRSIPDGSILQHLSSLKRPAPSPLDIMAVIGSASALKILNADPDKYNPKHWSEYLPRREALTKQFAAESHWSADAYWSWLDCIRKVAIPAVPADQPFMATKAWADKSMYTALASWTEMRHDTVLYAQQSVAAEQGEDGEERAPNLAKGYVEPNLPFYSCMLGLLHRTAAGLDQRSYLSPELRQEFKNLSDTVGFFKAISQKELKGQPLAAKEYARIRKIEGELEDNASTMLVTGVGYQNLTSDDRDPALVADFHTAQDFALEAAVGRADHVYAIVKLQGKLYLMRGASLSYYEFTKPASQRMTDHAWKDDLDNERVPPRPDWTKSFLVAKAVKES